MSWLTRSYRHSTRISKDRIDSEMPMSGIVNGVLAGAALWVVLIWLFV